MYPTAVAASVSYFRSQNPMLRRNVVVLLAVVLAYTQTAAGGPDTELVPEERVAEVVAGVVELPAAQPPSHVRPGEMMDS